MAAGAAIAGCGGGPAGAPADRAERSRSRDAAQALRVDAEGWKTDFSRHAAPLGEFRSGGPPRDGIPPIDDPRLVSVAAADEWLVEREPVLVVEDGGRARVLAAFLPGARIVGG